MSIKEEIKNKMLEMISQEKNNLEKRKELNVMSCASNYDCLCEEKFISKLEKFANSI